MNNEETLIAQPKAKEQNASKQEKNGKGRFVASVAAATAVGGIVGASGAAAAMTHNEEDNEAILKPEEQEPQANESKVDGVEDPQSENLQVAAAVDDVSEPDYTSHDNADPVLVDDQHMVQATLASDEPEVQVLGTYERTTEDGIHQTAAVITNGTEVAAVVDTTGDGYINTLAIDENGNGQIEDGETYDISDQHIPINAFDDTLAEQQQMTDMAYNASNDDNMPDYYNNANLDA